MDASAIIETAARLRERQAEMPPRAEIVEMLSDWAAQWRKPDSDWRRAAARLTEPFPFAHVELSLDALCDSMTPDALWKLIDAEDVRDARGAALIGHVIAGNTPLLAWTSVLRAMLMRSASAVKLPSGPAGEWGRLFAETLPAPLNEAVEMSSWTGGVGDFDAALCRSADLILAYGSDATLANLASLWPPQTHFVGYGHRVSFGLTDGGGADGFAQDVLLYDQSGCLSPQTIFVRGGLADARAFARALAAALAANTLPPVSRAPQAAARVQEARTLAQMEGGDVLTDETLRWTVIVRPDFAFAASPTHAVVSVQPLLSWDNLPAALAPVAGQLQGCAVAGDIPAALLAALGVSFVCPPGRLQSPPLSWREDGRDVLRTLRCQEPTPGFADPSPQGKGGNRQERFSP